MTATSIPFCTTRYLSCSYSPRPGLVIADASVSEASGEILQCEPSDPSDWSNSAAPECENGEWSMENGKLVEFTLELVNVCCTRSGAPGKESRIVLVIFSLKTKVPTYSTFYLTWVCAGGNSQVDSNFIIRSKVGIILFFSHVAIQRRATTVLGWEG